MLQYIHIYTVDHTKYNRLLFNTNSVTCCEHIPAELIYLNAVSLVSSDQ